MKSPVTLLSHLFDDVDRWELGLKGLDRDIITIESRFKHEGWGFLSLTLPILGNAIDYGLSVGRFACPSNFSKVRGGSIPKLLSGLICNVFDPITGLLLDRPHEHSLKSLREICFLFKKITVSQKREELLHAEAVQGFISTDDSILTNTFDEEMAILLSRVSSYVLPSLIGTREDVLKVKHGPGGVAEGYRANQKWDALYAELERDPYYAVKYGLDVVSRNRGIGHNQPELNQLSFDSWLKYADITNGLTSRQPFSGCAKLISVPKSSVARRTITAEPMLYQFIQQGWNVALRDSIKKCSVLSSCLSLTDQSKNQKLALLGSLNGEYATIDLSSASDLLSLDLVKLVFASKPDFLRSAIECRSARCNVDKVNVIEMQKFAGMGNALTFPVQSTVFALLAICGVLCTEGKDSSYVNVKRAAKRVRVYGDDIIVQTKHVSQVYKWLASFGLKVNQKKSFTTGNFRESCGVDAYRGVDVTPVYIRHWPLDTSGSPELVSSLVSSCNQLWMHGLHKAAKYLEHVVESLVGTLPLVSRTSPALGWHSRVDTNIAPCRWDRKLQRLVFRGLVVVPQMREDRLDGYAALMKCLHKLESRDSKDVLASLGLGSHDKAYHNMPDPVTEDARSLHRSVRRFHTRIRPRWMPAVVAGLVQ